MGNYYIEESQRKTKIKMKSNVKSNYLEEDKEIEFNRGGGAAGGGGLGKVAGLAILGVGAKAMKNYMDKQ